MTNDKTSQSLMEMVQPFIQKFSADISGATAIEYGLIAALISVAVIGGIKTISPATNGLWGDMTEKVVAVQ